MKLFFGILFGVLIGFLIGAVATVPTIEYWADEYYSHEYRMTENRVVIGDSRDSLYRICLFGDQGVFFVWPVKVAGECRYENRPGVKMVAARE